MRRTGRHALRATFDPADDRTRAALKRGAPLSSAARFVDRDDLSPASLLLEPCDRADFDGLVRVEFLVHPERTRELLAGVEFELLAGRRPLGYGRVLSGTGPLETSRRQDRGRAAQSMHDAIQNEEERRLSSAKGTE